MNDQAHHRVARIHLPVALNCNIQCAYCERRIDVDRSMSDRPGSCETIMTPEQAVREARDFLGDWGRHAIVGIAGPGDPLANSQTFDTLALVSRELPDARLCLCTNGLNLTDSIERLKASRVAYVTVTINGVDPKITSRIHSWVMDQGEKKGGVDGAAILLEKQISGIEKAVAAGIFIKVNTVAIPDINISHIPVIAKTVARLGAGVMNIMPLIPGGTFSHFKAPAPVIMSQLYKDCSQHVSVFKSCKQCRADARGIPGKERCTWKKTA